MSNTERVDEEPRRAGDTGLLTPATSEPASTAAGRNGEADTSVPRTAMGRWVESRTGLMGAIQRGFNPLVPRSARIRYALAAALVSALVVEFVTGLLLMCSYSPASSTAWGSTYYIDKVLTGGWFLRGLHNFAAHAMIIVTAIHLLGVVVAGVYRAPREVNWWLGLALLGIVVTFELSGNALVWDQDGYWAWNVETSIVGGFPFVGRVIQRLVVGGTDLGNAALGRLYALHVGLLPILTVFLLQAHILLARRHARVRTERGEPVFDRAWPGQTFLNMLATTLLLGIVSALVVYYHGAALDAPADPASQYPARPAWFFLWLFDMRKHFLGPREFIATLVIPGALSAVLFLMPFLDRLFPRRFAHFLAVAFSFTFLGAAAYLTVNSLQIDAADPHFRESVAAADSARDRAYELAELGIPPEGAAALLSHDPLYHGRAMLESKCLGCHVLGDKVGEKPTAPDLKDFASRAWIRGLLEKPDAPAYFGNTPKCDGMVEWKNSTKLTPKQLDDVADFVATFAAIPADVTPDEWLNSPGVADHPGLQPFTDDCGKCHVVAGLAEGGARDAPDLFAYGSPQWITRMIHKPGAPNLYGYLEKEDQMPGFAGQLTDNDVQTIVRYLRNDYPGAPGSKTEAAASQ